VVSPVLRNGWNREYFPLTEASSEETSDSNFKLDEESYRNAVIFTIVSLISSVSSGAVAYS
jgi:phage portal protein BeeE